MSKEQVLQIVRMKGPLLPIDVAKALKLDTIMSGAYLSELLGSKRVKITNLKVGGSPLYYVDEQKAKLVDYIKNLKGPEREAVNLLQEKKLLKNDTLTPLIRVSLQNSKDFAIPIEITINDQKAIFWKWYLTGNEELKSLFSPEKKEEDIKKDIKEDDVKDTNSDTSEPKEEKSEIKEEEKPKPVEEKSTPKEESKPEPKNEEKPKKEEPEDQDNDEPFAVDNSQLTDGSFFSKVLKFLSKNDIDIITQKVIRVDSEIEFQLLIPTPVGKVKFYAVAKSKKKLQPGDLAQIYVEAEIKKLPGILLYTGDLSKKSQEELKVKFKILTAHKL